MGISYAFGNSAALKVSDASTQPSMQHSIEYQQNESKKAVEELSKIH